MKTSLERMKRIYQSIRPYASLNVLLLLLATPSVYGGTPVPVVWAQPHHMVAGDGFLALGYRAGLEIWAWSLDTPFQRTVWQSGEEIRGLKAVGNDIMWATDSALSAARYTGTDLAPLWTIPDAGRCEGLTASDEWVAMLVRTKGQSEVRYWERVSPDSVRRYRAPGDAAIATIALRDSTLAAVGAGHVWLSRLSSDIAITIDSTEFPVFASAIDWAGDTLLLAFGFSGLKLAPTSGGHFSAPAQSYSDGGFYEFLTVWDGGWASLGLFGQMLTFRRGDSLAPLASLQSEGTSWGLAAQAGQVAVLTAEYGISTLNVFTPQTPFWVERMRLPGVVRALDYSRIGMLAVSDFEGVLRLDKSSHEWLMSFPYNAMDLDVEGNLVAATMLLTGTAIFDLDAPPVQEPASIVHTSVFTRQSELSGDQMYVFTTAACDDSGFAICDISNPGDARVESRWSVCMPIHDLERVPGGLAVAMGDSGIWVYRTPITERVAPAARSTDQRKVVQLAWRTGELWSRDDSGTVMRWQWTGDALIRSDQHTFDGLIWLDAWESMVATSTADSVVRVWSWEEGTIPVEVEAWEASPPARLVSLVADTIWFVEHDIVYRAAVGTSAGIEEGDEIVRPEYLVLGETYPNPFNGATTIPLNLRPGDWDVSVYNVLGQCIRTWHGRSLRPGPYELQWNPELKDGTSRGSGVYFIRASSGGIVETRKVMYLK